ncbi:MAG: aminomethyl transferase family protein [Acidobacteria bacterium]|nr:aminomethyl transferase family protein [Acidobacteriota bacterium]
MSAGYDALRRRAAWLDLTDRGKIFALGEDRARLLHAMTTNHVQQLQPSQGCYAFFLNAQGRILGDVNLFCLEDRFLLDVEPETRHSLYQHLDKFIIADDVTLEDASERMAVLGVEGPQSGEALAAMGAPVPETPFGHAAWEGRTVARVSFTGAEGFRIFAPPEDLPALAANLEAADAEAARLVRLENGKPRYGEDIFDTTLTAETQQNHALHFSKGCYLGQEVVERVRSRGHVNRLLVAVEIEGSEPPEPHAILTVDGAEVGRMCSSGFSPAMGRVVGLAYIRVSHAAPGAVLSAAGKSCLVRQHPAGRL